MKYIPLLIIKRCLVGLSMIAISACSTVEKTERLSHVGNQFDVSLTRSSSVRVVEVDLAEKPWTGKFTGGEEMVKYRKRQYIAIGEHYMKKACSPVGYISKTTPDFVMNEHGNNHAMAQFGLLGMLASEGIGAWMSDYEDLPIQYKQSFICSDETDGVKER